MFHDQHPQYLGTYSLLQAPEDDFSSIYSTVKHSSVDSLGEEDGTATSLCARDSSILAQSQVTIPGSQGDNIASTPTSPLTLAAAATSPCRSLPIYQSPDNLQQFRFESEEEPVELQMQGHYCEVHLPERQISSARDPACDCLTFFSASSTVSPSNPHKPSQEMQAYKRLAKNPTTNENLYASPTAHLSKVAKKEAENRGLPVPLSHDQSDEILQMDAIGNYEIDREMVLALQSHKESEAKTEGTLDDHPMHDRETDGYDHLERLQPGRKEEKYDYERD